MNLIELWQIVEEFNLSDWSMWIVDSSAMGLLGNLYNMALFSIKNEMVGEGRETINQNKNLQIFKVSSNTGGKDPNMVAQEDNLFIVL